MVFGKSKIFSATGYFNNILQKTLNKHSDAEVWVLNYSSTLNLHKTVLHPRGTPLFTPALIFYLHASAPIGLAVVFGLTWTKLLSNLEIKCLNLSPVSESVHCVSTKVPGELQPKAGASLI